MPRAIKDAVFTTPACRPYRSVTFSSSDPTGYRHILPRLKSSAEAVSFSVRFTPAGVGVSLAQPMKNREWFLNIVWISRGISITPLPLVLL
jgi:hypothetical protein